MKQIDPKFTDVVANSDGKLGYSHFPEETSMTSMSGQKIHGRLPATQVYEKIGGHWFITQEHKSLPVVRRE
jgi:ketosteroid isomerase-like protein